MSIEKPVNNATNGRRRKTTKTKAPVTDAAVPADVEAATVTTEAQPVAEVPSVAGVVPVVESQPTAEAPAVEKLKVPVTKPQLSSQDLIIQFGYARSATEMEAFIRDNYENDELEGILAKGFSLKGGVSNNHRVSYYTFYQLLRLQSAGLGDFRTIIAEGVDLYYNKMFHGEDVS